MRYPGVQKFMNAAVENARQKGYAETAFKRKRYIPEIYHRKAVQRGFGERMAINSPIQGTAADIIKKAMIKLDNLIVEKNLQSKMILQVHDELIFEVPDSEIDIMKKLVPKTMEKVAKLKVPLKVDLAIGTDWSQYD